jgi:hypothetical protein
VAAGVVGVGSGGTGNAGAEADDVDLEHISEERRPVRGRRPVRHGRRWPSPPLH